MEILNFEHLNLGNNYQLEHLIKALKEVNFDFDTLKHIDLYQAFTIKANINFGFKISFQIYCFELLELYQNDN